MSFVLPLVRIVCHRVYGVPFFSIMGIPSTHSMPPKIPLPFLKEYHIKPSDMGALMMKGKLKERIMEILKIHGDLNFLFL